MKIIDLEIFLKLLLLYFFSFLPLQAALPGPKAPGRCVLPLRLVSGATDSYTQLLRKHLLPGQESWYTHYVELPEVDPGLREVAKILIDPNTKDFDGHPIPEFKTAPYAIISGSNSFEAGFLQSRLKLAEKGGLEVNALFPKRFTSNLYLSFLDPVTRDVPAYQGREAAKWKIFINGETNVNVETLSSNANKGRYLLNNNDLMNVPFKHASLLVVPANEAEPARLYFRTAKDAQNYLDKKLAFADEITPAAKAWHLVQEPRNLQQAVDYALIVYARLKSQDKATRANVQWTYTESSKQILLSWINYLKKKHPEIIPKLKSDLEQKTKEQSGSDVLESVFSEFGIP